MTSQILGYMYMRPGQTTLHLFSRKKKREKKENSRKYFTRSSDGFKGPRYSSWQAEGSTLHFMGHAHSLTQLSRQLST